MDNNGRGQVLHPTRIDIESGVRSQLITILNHTLAYTLDLKTQVKQAHWNVKGMEFYQLHELFDAMAGELEEFVDSFAERVTALGGIAMGTARMAVSVSTLPDYPIDILDGADHVTALADRYAIYAKLVRDGIAKTDELGDADTADLYTEVSRDIDKRLWFLDAHLGETTLTLRLPMSSKASTPSAGSKPAQSKAPASTATKSATSSKTAPKTAAKAAASKSGASTKSATVAKAKPATPAKSATSAKSTTAAKSAAATKSTATAKSATAVKSATPAKSAPADAKPSTSKSSAEKTANPTAKGAQIVKAPTSLSTPSDVAANGSVPKVGSRAKGSRAKK